MSSIITNLASKTLKRRLLPFTQKPITIISRSASETETQKLERIADILLDLTKIERHDYAILFRHKMGLGHYGPAVSGAILGIDPGTTNSAVAAMEGGKPTIVTNAEGQRTTPSVGAYTANGDRVVGQIAKRQAVVNPENTFFSVKRFIGRKMSEVDEESKQVSHKVVRDEIGNVKLECVLVAA
ncbi:hypothetical protein DKX38_029588 [Salix brachista]|uniref:Uncharacterized protein n=1 Tax=Salix brachista TaxID=2182728 RepID=A0A5N5IZK4_9ROSI|nr:hypothetical protein DKX38_029586 [Salix brachista]KAB5512560.1 hypothetical protein DKX38_029588 [Salix brachista]